MFSTVRNGVSSLDVDLSNPFLKVWGDNADWTNSHNNFAFALKLTTENENGLYVSLWPIPPTLCIAYSFISNLWQLLQEVDSFWLSGRALDFKPGGPDSTPTRVTGFFFQLNLLCFFLCYGFHVVRFSFNGKCWFMQTIIVLSENN